MKRQYEVELRRCIEVKVFAESAGEAMAEAVKLHPDWTLDYASCQDTGEGVWYDGKCERCGRILTTDDDRLDEGDVIFCGECADNRHEGDE